jgi:hypothetical protein
MSCRSGITVLPIALSACALLLVMGMTSSLSVSSSRRLLERLQSRRMADSIAASALEEACARVEADIPPIPVGSAKAAVTWPGRVTPTHTAAEAKSMDADVSDVYVSAGPWRLYRGKDPAGKTLVNMLWVVQLSARVSVAAQGAPLIRELVVRRYGYADLDPTGKFMRIHVHPVNIAQITGGI